MISTKKGIVLAMKKLISVFGYLAYIFLALAMISTAKDEMSNLAENSGLFARKFGIELGIAGLGPLCTVLTIYVAIAVVALLIKMSHAALGSGFCGALNMLFDTVFCIIHGLVIYAFVTDIIPANAGARAYVIALFVVSLLTLFSNGASISKPAAKK